MNTIDQFMTVFAGWEAPYQLTAFLTVVMVASWLAGRLLLSFDALTRGFGLFVITLFWGRPPQPYCDCDDYEDDDDDGGDDPDGERQANDRPPLRVVS